MGVEEVDGECGQMVEIVHAGLGDAEMCLTIGDPSDDCADHENRDQHQWQNDNSHLPANLEVVDKFKHNGP